MESKNNKTIVLDRSWGLSHKQNKIGKLEFQLQREKTW